MRIVITMTVILTILQMVTIKANIDDSYINIIFILNILLILIRVKAFL